MLEAAIDFNIGVTYTSACYSSVCDSIIWDNRAVNIIKHRFDGLPIRNESKNFYPQKYEKKVVKFNISRSSVPQHDLPP